MKTVFRAALGCALVLALVLLLGGIGAAWLVGANPIADGALSIDINGRPLTDISAWHWALAAGGGLLAMLLVLLTVMWGVLAALAGLGVVLLAVAAVLLLALSPLWLVGLLVWLLLRRKPASADAIRA